MLTGTDIPRAALAAYALDLASTIEPVTVSENVTHRVTDAATGRRYALRVGRPGYTDPRAVAAEVHWMEALRTETPVRIPAPVRTVDGSSAVVVNSRVVTLFEWIPGRTPGDDDPARWFAQIGAIAAKLHRHSRSWQRPAGFTRRSWTLADQLGPHGHWGRWQRGLGLDADARATLDRAVAVIADRIADFGCGPEVFGLLHFDLRAANLIVDAETDGEITVIDFDDCGFSWYLYDLASSLSFVEDRPDVPELIDTWLQGYRTVAPVSAAEESMIDVFITMRRILLTAWIASHPEAETARELGSGFTAGTLAVAEALLRR